MENQNQGENAILTAFHASLGSGRILASAHLGCCSKSPCGKFMSCLIHKRSLIHKDMALILKLGGGNSLLLHFLINDFNDCFLSMWVAFSYELQSLKTHIHNY